MARDWNGRAVPGSLFDGKTQELLGNLRTEVEERPADQTPPWIVRVKLGDRLVTSQVCATQGEVNKVLFTIQWLAISLPDLTK